MHHRTLYTKEHSSHKYTVASQRHRSIHGLAMPVDEDARYKLHISLLRVDKPDRLQSPLTSAYRDLFVDDDVHASLGPHRTSLGNLQRLVSKQEDQGRPDILDSRLQQLSIEYLAPMPAPTHSLGAEPPVPSSTSSSTLWQSYFNKSGSFPVDDNNGDSKASEVSFGILHMFKDDASSRRETSQNAAPTVALEDETATILAILGLPSQMTAADFLQWIEPALQSVEKIRIVRQGKNLSKCTVLVKFRDPIDAEEFYKQYSRRSLPFFATSAEAHHRDPAGSETSPAPSVAQIVYVTQVTVSSTTQLPYAYPQLANSDPWPLAPATVEGAAPGADSASSSNAATPATRLALSLANELPTCPVCLERMDSSVTGIMTVSCQHTFHCECLSRWGDGRCPVCRYSQNRAAKSGPASLFARRRTQGDARGNEGSSSGSNRVAEGRNSEVPEGDSHEHEEEEATQCTLCGTTDDLWVCLICATVGCGRYKKGCAKRHFVESGHIYSLELETSRVWDYIHDGYIHRLIQNRADGKLVELPSSSTSTPSRSNQQREQRRRQRSRHRRKERERSVSQQAGTSQAGGQEAANEGQDQTNDTIDDAGYATSDFTDDDEDNVRDAHDYAKSDGKLGTSDDKVEAISLEYQYLLLSQLESQRSYYEDQVRHVQGELEVERAEGRTAGKNAVAEKEEQLEAQRREWEQDREAMRQRERNLSARCDKAVALSSQLARDLQGERSVSKGLMTRLEQMTTQVEGQRKEMDSLRATVQEQQEQLRDLMFALSAGEKMREEGESVGQGGDVFVPPGETRSGGAGQGATGASNKKKKKKVPAKPPMAGSTGGGGGGGVGNGGSILGDDTELDAQGAEAGAEAEATTEADDDKGS